jgi:hypothetical protein
VVTIAYGGWGVRDMSLGTRGQVPPESKPLGKGSRCLIADMYLGLFRDVRSTHLFPWLCKVSKIH